MFTFTYSVGNIAPLNKDNITHKINKWLERGHPIRIANLQLFHLGRLYAFDKPEELINFIYNHKDLINFCSIASVDKELPAKEK